MKEEIAFEKWMAKANAHVEATVLLSYMDLPDWQWRVAYEDEMTPSAAAKAFLHDLHADGIIPDGIL